VQTEGDLFLQFEGVGKGLLPFHFTITFIIKFIVASFFTFQLTVRVNNRNLLGEMRNMHLFFILFLYYDLRSMSSTIFT
jgi:hypothetical protein